MAVGSGLRQIGLICFSVLLGASIFALSLLSFRYWLFLKLPTNPSSRNRIVEIKPGEDSYTIAKLLEIKGVISDAHQFYLLCRLRKSSHRLQAGEYEFAAHPTPVQVLDQLVGGRVMEHRVTIPEGATIYDVARIIGKSGLASENAILNLSKDAAFIRGLGLDVPSLEGYLFPDTYFFRKPQSPGSILKALVRQLRAHFSDAWVKHAEKNGLTVQDVLILASMVEKEAKVNRERPMIAAVFLNRLGKGMLLQCDPTTVYDLQGFTGHITASDLKRASPYNTYLNKGLPMGPICNPGLKSIEAVVYPEDVPYLYFVSNNDGTHHFSETLAEHHQAVVGYYEKRKASGQDEEKSAPSEDWPPVD
jgi:UPF0755 protein